MLLLSKEKAAGGRDGDRGDGGTGRRERAEAAQSNLSMNFGGILPLSFARSGKTKG